MLIGASHSSSATRTRQVMYSPAARDDYRNRYGGYGKMIYPLPAYFRRLRDGQTPLIGEHQWQVIVGSVHSPEHDCFYCPELKLLISADQVLPQNWAVHQATVQIDCLHASGRTLR